MPVSLGLYHMGNSCLCGLSLPCLSQVQKIVSDIELKERDIFDYKKKITEAEHNLQQRESQFERVVKEKNSFSKNLLEAQVGADYHSVRSSGAHLEYAIGVIHSHPNVCLFEPCLLQDEITETKKRMKMLSGQVMHLRSEVTENELALAKDQQENERLNKDNENLKVLEACFGCSCSDLRKTNSEQQDKIIALRFKAFFFFFCLFYAVCAKFKS